MGRKTKETQEPMNIIERGGVFVQGLDKPIWGGMIDASIRIGSSSTLQ